MLGTYLVYNTVVWLCQFFVVGGNSSQNENTFLQKILLGYFIGKNRQNLHVFNLWPVIYHTKKNSCGNPTPEMLSVKLYMSQQDYPKSTSFYFVAIDLSQQKALAARGLEGLFFQLGCCIVSVYCTWTPINLSSRMSHNINTVIDVTLLLRLWSCCTNHNISATRTQVYFTDRRTDRLTN
jgi:hypothetical protein